MAIYSFTQAVSTGATGAAYTTVLGIKFANTAGHRARLRKVSISGNEATDRAVAWRVDRSDNTTDGTSTAGTTANILQHDPDSAASNVSAIGYTYTVEPTTVAADTGIGGSFNCRGGDIKEWAPGSGPLWGKNQTLLIKAAPATSNATALVVSVEWEEGI
jgi:hypothetical protein